MFQNEHPDIRIDTTDGPWTWKTSDVDLVSALPRFHPGRRFFRRVPCACSVSNSHRWPFVALKAGKR
jgi:hypothetical protein